MEYDLIEMQKKVNELYAEIVDGDASRKTDIDVQALYSIYREMEWYSNEIKNQNLSQRVGFYKFINKSSSDYLIEDLDLIYARERILLEKLFPGCTERGYCARACFYDKYASGIVGRDIPFIGDKTYTNKSYVDNLIYKSPISRLKKSLKFDDIGIAIAVLDLENLKKVAPLLIEHIDRQISKHKTYCDYLSKNDFNVNKVLEIKKIEEKCENLSILKNGLIELFPECQEKQELNWGDE